MAKEKLSKEQNEIKEVLTKVIIGVLKGVKLTNKECGTLCKHINHQDELIKEAILRLRR